MKRDFTPEEIREYIKQQKCWLCGQGNFKSLPNHMVLVHGITAREMRDMAYLTTQDSLISPTLSEYFSSNCQKRLGDKRWNKGGRKGCIFTEKGREIHKIIAQKILAPLRSYECQRKPHNCPMCGKFINNSHPLYCSTECFRKYRSKSMRKRCDDNWGKFRNCEKSMWERYETR